MTHGTSSRKYRLRTAQPVPCPRGSIEFDRRTTECVSSVPWPAGQARGTFVRWSFRGGRPRWRCNVFGSARTSPSLGVLRRRPSAAYRATAIQLRSLVDLEDHVRDGVRRSRPDRESSFHRSRLTSSCRKVIRISRGMLQSRACSWMRRQQPPPCGWRGPLGGVCEGAEPCGLMHAASMNRGRRRNEVPRQRSGTRKQAFCPRKTTLF